MALCAAGGIGTALAVVSKTKAESTSTSSYDKAIYLYWDHESEESASLSSMESVTEEPQYRYLEVSPKSSKTLTGTVTVSFTLAEQSEGVPAGKTATTKGITVEVYALGTDATALNVAEKVEAAASPECTLVGPSALTGQASFAVAAGSGVHETVQRYGIKVTWAPAGVLSTEKVSAQLTIAQSFAATPAA